jgi:hypothetical protein
MTRMPCLVDEDADGLAVRGHVARADPFASAPEGPLLLVFGGATSGMLLMAAMANQLAR